jgi:hypothetical protein
MRRILNYAAVPLLVVFAASCTDSPVSPESGPESPTNTVSFATVDVDAGDVTTETLLAGQDIPVGEVSVTHNGDGTVDIEYQMFSGFCLTETHWEANYDQDNLTNQAGQPVPGQFAYGDDMLDCATSYSETGDILGTPDDEYVVAAHAVVVGAESGDNPHVVFGTYDADGDDVEEGDIYGINPTTGDLTLVAEIGNDAGGDPFYPNGLAIDRDSEELFYVTDSEDLYKVPAQNADPTSVVPTLVFSGLNTGAAGEGSIRSATVDGDFFYYVPNGTETLWRIGTDGTGNAAYCDLDAPGDGLFFGDIASDPDNPGTIFGTARIDNGSTGTVHFFEIDVDGVDDCTVNGGTFSVPTTYSFQIQLAFGAGGTLYGQQAISEPSADNPGQWYIVDSTTGEITSTLAITERSFTDLAGGLPFEPVEFDETAWADGDRFTNRGNWATFMGPFDLTEE